MTGDLRVEQVRAAAPHVRIAIFYEDVRAGLRGRRFAEALAERLGDRSGLEVSLWRVDLLGEPGCTHEASRAVAACDYVLIVVQGEQVPAALTRSWLRRHLPMAREHGSSIIFLPGCESAARRTVEATRRFLRRTCAHHGVPFFSLVSNPATAMAASPAGDAEQPLSCLCL